MHCSLLTLHRMESLLLRRRVLLLELLKKEKRGKRKWMRDIMKKRSDQGDFNNLVQELRLRDIDGFFSYFRMTPETFDMLLEMVGSNLQRQNTNYRKCISPAERLSITLRYLATGDSMTSISFSYRVGISTVSSIVKETCNVIWNKLGPVFLPEPDVQLWEKSSLDFNKYWNFPNCIGVLDGKHIHIQAPEDGGLLLHNYKDTHSIVLLAICDSTYCYTVVDIGAYGKQNDPTVFSQSTLGSAIQNENYIFPTDKCLPGTTIPMPLTFIADEAFPLKCHLMRPYPGRGLDNMRRAYNYRLSRVRRIVENVFGITANRWRILKRPIIASVPTVEGIVKAVVCLHNFLCRTEQKSSVCNRYYMPSNYIDSEEDGINISGQWRINGGDSAGWQNIGRTSSNTYSRDAKKVRDMFAKYFVENPLPWQQNVLMRGFI